MRLFLATLALVPAAGLFIVSPAVAQAQAIAVGMPVIDTQGGPVGTVKAIQGDVIVVKTDRHEVALPKASFTGHEGKLLFGMTRAELNDATDQSLAAAAAALQPGATVKGSAGTVVGTIDSIDTEFVTLKLESGNLIRLPRNGIAASADGAVIGLTADQLEGQVAATPSGTE